MEQLGHLPHLHNVVLTYHLSEHLPTKALQSRQQIHVGHAQHVKHVLCCELDIKIKSQSACRQQWSALKWRWLFLNETNLLFSNSATVWPTFYYLQMQRRPSSFSRIQKLVNSQQCGPIYINIYFFNINTDWVNGNLCKECTSTHTFFEAVSTDQHGRDLTRLAFGVHLRVHIYVKHSKKVSNRFFYSFHSFTQPIQN